MLLLLTPGCSQHNSTHCRMKLQQFFMIKLVSFYGFHAIFTPTHHRRCSCDNPRESKIIFWRQFSEWAMRIPEWGSKAIPRNQNGKHPNHHTRYATAALTEPCSVNLPPAFKKQGWTNCETRKWFAETSWIRVRWLRRRRPSEAYRHHSQRFY